MTPEEPRKETMSRSTIIAIGAIVVILVVGATLLMNQNNSPSTTSTTSSTPIDTSDDTDIATATPEPSATIPSTASTATATPAQTSQSVAYTDSGFSPKSITVSAGTTVTFVNQSSHSMWVASDPHPTHTDYKGFDELAGVSSGQSYSFTFTKTGTWGYHNHLRSGDTGTIIVK